MHRRRDRKHDPRIDVTVEQNRLSPGTRLGAHHGLPLQDGGTDHTGGPRRPDRPRPPGGSDPQDFPKFTDFGQITN